MTAQTRIGRLTLRAHPAFGTAARHATERRLHGLDWQPPGMPPSGILLIRRMDDPLPGTFDLSGRDFAAPKGWREAVRVELGNLYQRARRPHGTGGAHHARAIYFDCLADLLAWLACTLDQGTPGWWWRPARRSLATQGTGSPELRHDMRTASLLEAFPEQLPAVIASVSRRGHLLYLAKTLDGAEATRLLHVLSAAFSLSPQVTGTDTAYPFAIRASLRGPPPEATTARRDEVALDVSPPWAGELRSSGMAGIAPSAQSALIGLALALHRRPLCARSPGFALQAAMWWARTGTPALKSEPAARAADLPGSGEAPRPDVTAPHSDPDWKADLADDAARRPQTKDAANNNRRAQPRCPQQTPATKSTAPGHGLDPPPEILRHSGEAPARPLSENADARMYGTAPTPAIPSDPEPANLSDPLPGERVVTQWGGLFYLIHCLDDLGIPGDPALNWPVETVGLWGALGGIGRMLLADIGCDAACDPIWDVFAALEPPMPAPRFEPADIRAPHTWPAQLADDPPALCYGATTRRLRLWSQAGYLLADIARNSQRPAEQARQEAARLGCPPTRITRRRAPKAPMPPALRLPDPALAQAARAVTRAVRRRLCLSLGLAPQDTQGLRRMAGVTATICLSASHIDMIARLDQISLPVRAAGLDRDPGWRADLGRVVQFHFQ